MHKSWINYSFIMSKYTTIQLPTEFVHEVVDALVQARWGFTSRADVVREGVKLVWEKYMGKGQTVEKKIDDNKTITISGSNLTYSRRSNPYTFPSCSHDS